METRTCARCGTERSVAEIWYLVGDEKTSFVCELCYEEGSRQAPMSGETV